MTPWGAIEALEKRVAAIEDALGALEYGGSRRDPRVTPIFWDYYEMRQARLREEKAKQKAPPVSAGEPSFDDKVDGILEKYGLRNYPDI